MKKRILALFLSVLMLLSAAPISPVFAIENEPLDNASLYTALLNAQTLDEFSALLNNNLEDDESVQAFFAAFDEEKMDKLVEKSDALKAAYEAEEIVIERVEVDFSNVGPFMPAVRGPQKKMLKAGAKGASGNEENPASNDGDDEAHERLDNDDIETMKTVTPNGDGTYTLKLETYVTGKTIKKTIVEEIPTDIILVLDQSGSMAESMRTYSYTEAYPTNHNGTYYIKDGDIPREVTWCSDCNSWTYGCRDGWIIIIPYHNDGTKVTPKTSASDTAANHVQFYTRHEGATVRRLDALIDAVTLFANNVTDKATATETGVNHRIAIVGFSDSSGYGYGNPKNTEILTVDNLTNSSIPTYYNRIGYYPDNNNGTFYFPDNENGRNYKKDGAQYGSITTTQYKNALRDMSTEAGQQNVSNAIKALSAYGYTNTLDGLDMAAEIFANNPIPTEEKRNRVVILFTDGDTDSSKTDVVNKAYDLKNTYGATVYSIGILENANGTPPITSGTSEANALLHRISSNYPDATAKDVLNRWGNYDHTEYTNGDLNPNLVDGQSYYLSTDNAETLSTIFQQISSEIEAGGSNVTLDSSTVVKDVVTPQFTIHTGTSSVTAHSETFIGVTGEGDNTVMNWERKTGDASYTPTVDTATNTVTVTGFDFAANYVGMDETDGVYTPHGKKLVIEIIIDPQDGDVKEALENGWIPTNGNTSGVYGEEDDEPVPFEEYEIPKVEPYKINVTHVFFDADGNKQSATPKESNVYALPNMKAPIAVTGQEYAPTYKFVGWYSEETCTNRLSTELEYNAEATSDGVTYYAKYVLDTAKYTVKHVLVEPDGTTIEKTEHQTEKTGTIGTKTQAVANTYTNYTAREITQEIITADGKTVVTVYYDRQLGSLKVGKTGMETGETAIFVVTGKGLPETGLRIAVENGKTVTVTNLWVGETYTVTEEGEWTWRYTADEASKEATITSATEPASVSFENGNGKTKWLDAFDYVKNLFKKPTSTNN